ncbi:MAG: dihydrodipicolinate synthase family protein [Clostridiales bacterium]|nr:dihydrodipicolinate synthase family protein [Clostridiales bacterium]
MYAPKGVYVAMITPFEQGNRIAEKTIREMVEFFIERGVDGIFPVSNVGEFVQLSEDQKRLFVDIVLDQAKGRVRVTPGISATAPWQSIEFGKYCQSAGADGVVLSAPYYYKYPQEIVCSSCAEVAKSLDIPVVLYNIPLFANEISLESLKKLMEIDNIVAIKESSGSIPNLIDIINLANNIRPDFNVLVGWEELFLSTLVLGGKGCMVASGGILPELMVAIYKSFLAGEIDRAARYQSMVARVTEQMKKIFFPYGYKLGMEARGFDMGPFCIDVPDDYREEIMIQKETIKNAINDVLNSMDAI